jgi:hypothetical protein
LSAYVSVFFDLLILGALGATIRYSLKLSKQFERMQADRKVFEQLIQALNVASARAEAAIRALKEAATEGGDKLQEKINAGRALSEELEIMVQAGDNLAERLGALATQSRKAAVPDEVPAQPRTRAEKELLEAVKAKQT